MVEDNRRILQYFLDNWQPPRMMTDAEEDAEERSASEVASMETETTNPLPTHSYADPKFCEKKGLPWPLPTAMTAATSAENDGDEPQANQHE